MKIKLANPGENRMNSKAVFYMSERSKYAATQGAEQTRPYGLPPLNINTKASVSMQYILNPA